MPSPLHSSRRRPRQLAQRADSRRGSPTRVVEQGDPVGVGADHDDVADRFVDHAVRHRFGVVKAPPRVHTDADREAGPSRWVRRSPHHRPAHPPVRRSAAGIAVAPRISWSYRWIMLAFDAMLRWESRRMSASRGSSTVRLTYLPRTGSASWQPFGAEVARRAGSRSGVREPVCHRCEPSTPDRR